MKKLIILLIVLTMLLASCSDNLNEKIKAVRDEITSGENVSLDNTSEDNDDSLSDDTNGYDSALYEKKVMDVKALHESFSGDWEYYDTLETIMELKRTIDVNTYFNIFTHISVNEGYILDYYFYPGANGKPVLYYAKTEEYDPDISSLYLIDEDGYAQFEKRPMGSRVNSPVEFTNFIEFDGSKDSYLEFAILTTIAGQFALKWHSNYFDHTPVISEGMLDYVLESMWNQNFKDVDKSEAEKLETEPVFEEKDGLITVSFLYFTKWEGFVKRILTFDTEKNNRLVDIQEETVLEYDCGIRF